MVSYFINPQFGHVSNEFRVKSLILITLNRFFIEARDILPQRPDVAKKLHLYLFKHQIRRLSTSIEMIQKRFETGFMIKFRLGDLYIWLFFSNGFLFT